MLNKTSFLRGLVFIICITSLTYFLLEASVNFAENNSSEISASQKHCVLYNFLNF